MKLKHLTLLAAMALPLVALGRPADTRPQKYTNPDGTVVEVRQFGDEFFSYITDAEGTMLMEINPEGFVRPAIRAGRTLTPVKADIQTLLDENPGAMELRLKADKTRMAARDENGRSVYPAMGDDIHALVVLVEFADVPFSVPNPQEQYTRACNQEGYSDFNGVGSARDYFIACSDGKYKPTFDVYGPVKVPETREYYVDPKGGYPGAGKYGKIREAWKSALDALDDEVDFSKYDYDEDGLIDNVFFFFAGYGQADNVGKPYIWPHQSSYSGYRGSYGGIEYDGVIFNPYACSNELIADHSVPAGQKQPYIDGIGSFSHEYGHVLGIPDFYDIAGGNTETPGDMDIMCGGSYNRNSTQPPLYNGYEKWLLHWLEYENIEDGKAYTLPSLASSNRALRVRIERPSSGEVRYYDNEYFVVETRGTDSWDESLPDHGLLVWHVRYNEAAWESSQVNVGNNPRFRIMTPAYGYCWGTEPYNFIYPEGDVTLKPVDNRSGYLEAYLTQITYDEDALTTTFNYNIDTEVPAVETNIHKPVCDQDNREVTISWDEVPGAVNYYFSVYYNTSSGAKKYINGLNKSSVGKVNTITFSGFNTKTWKETITVEVTPVLSLPSSITSSLKFVPADAESGIEDVAGESFEVAAGHGFITAPAGAEVYNLNGMRTASDNLPAGVYIVRYGNQTRKVLVK